jgi:hypothetical protein
MKTTQHNITPARGAIALTALLVLVAAAGCLRSIDRGLNEQQIQGEIEPMIPPPWRLYGPTEGTLAYDYIGGVDTRIKRSGARSACFLSVEVTNDDQARWTQRFRADRWRGKRVRFAAYLKTYRVGEWAGLWMRIDTDTRQSYAFDDSEDRPLSGTTDWTPMEVVLDVPENAAVIYLGAHMYGQGQVWMDDCTFTEVGEDVRTSDRHRLRGGYQRQFRIPDFLGDEPLNMGFEEDEVM